MKELLLTARKYIGVKEVPGTASDPRITGWLYRFARNVKLSYIRLKGDEVAWCAAFVSAVLEECGYRGTDSALAVSYTKWGKPSKAVPGCVVVIKRRVSGEDKRTGSRRGYHVMFLERFGKNWIRGTGGNMRNQVRTASYSRKHYKVVAFRRPSEL